MIVRESNGIGYSLPYRIYDNGELVGNVDFCCTNYFIEIFTEAWDRANDPATMTARVQIHYTK